ncbi:hypothetical protein [Halomonas dongshanensis]|nr:hypothetical protein [Halomonas dongshanensis]
MANALGVFQQKLLEICSQGGANSAMLAPVIEWVLERECTKLKFSLGNAEKDMRYLTETLATYQARSAMLPPLCEFLSRAKKDQGEDSFVPTAYDTCVKK